MIRIPRNNRVLAERKILLIDLDGTLTNTANIAFQPMKDGQKQTDLSRIEIFEGAREFISEATDMGFQCIIVSDSHPKYVNTIVKEYFSNVSALPLADKPNTLKTLDFLQRQNIEISDSNCYVLGDSWLDIELGRGLGVPTVLTAFYEAPNLEIKDGIGDYVKNIKSGPTYYAESYDEILNILRNPLPNLLCLEAGCRSAVSYLARKPRPDDFLLDSSLSAHRILARQSQGECDKYHITEKYFELSRPDRRRELLFTLGDSVIAYIDSILEDRSFLWDIFTYVPDKRTTQPANKMGELFDLIAELVGQRTASLNCLSIFEWNEAVGSSTRKQSSAPERREFVDRNLMLRDEVNVRGKSIIILDDQYTTGATAEVLAEKLRARGAKNILFIALFHLITPVDSSKLCPKCLKNGRNKQLLVKINRKTGNRFYSCVPPQYKGDGCGYTENRG
jgi:phosphoglycolate phosphatase-like HAD superfamily hydrolase